MSEIAGVGHIRIVGKPPKDGYILVSHDCSIEVRQSDGTWLPLPVVRKATITLDPNKTAIVALEVYVEELDLSELEDVSETGA